MHCTAGTWLREKLLPHNDILTRNSFLNAIAIVNNLGGSTNAVRMLFLSFPAY
jgi:dihydroxyacid dehydratase/phosphogluconate dehydratase